jgi:sugar lactone lactonase YvrE
MAAHWRQLAFAAVALVIGGAAVAQPVVNLDPALGEFPEGVEIDKPGNIWVTVQPLCEVRRYTPDGKETLRLRVVPEADCIWTVGLAVDATGVLFVAVRSTNPATHGLLVVDAQRRGKAADLPPVVSHIAGTEQISSPNALAFDHHNGALFVTDLERGAVWRIGPQGDVALWIEHPVLLGTPDPPFFPPGTLLGANGIAVADGAVYVAVTFVPRLVRIGIDEYGSAETPEVLVAPPQFFAAGAAFLDGLQLDVLGNVYLASPSLPGIVAVDASQGWKVSTVASGLGGSPLSLVFGTGKGSRQDLFVTVNSSFGGFVNGLVRVPVGMPGMPLP